MHKNLIQLTSKYENDLLELKNQDKHCQINIDALQGTGQIFFLTGK